MARLFIFVFGAFATSTEVPSSSSFPQTVQHFAPENASCRSSVEMPDGTPQQSMLQKTFKTVDGHFKAQQANEKLEAESSLYVWGATLSEHPRSIGKWAPHPKVQYYEAALPRLSGMVLNIFSKASNGDGGLMLAMEVPSPCHNDTWVEVDRSRCSSRYPCALHLPGSAVRGSNTEPIKFRIKAVPDDEDYLTDFLEYDRVTLDHDAEVVVAHEKHNMALLGGNILSSSPLKKTLKFDLDPVLAAGALTVMPVITGGNSDTVVTMRLRQPDPLKKNISQKKASLVDSGSSMAVLEKTLQSYRKSWAGEWRSPAQAISGCGFPMFEVVGDQLYPGPTELEVWASGSDEAVISDVLVTARVSWAEAEVTLLDTILKDHFAFFNDPDEIIHGLPMDAVKKENLRQLTDSNPCEWGYAMESWVIMAETGFSTPVEAVTKLNVTFDTLNTLQKDPQQFAHGLFYPFYRLRNKQSGDKLFPKKTESKDIPCGDDALLYASMMMVQGWLVTNKFHQEAAVCQKILSRFDFSHCVRMTDCNGEGNGMKGTNENKQGDKFWSIPLTFKADTLEHNTFNWNVFADEGGIVSMIVALNGAVNNTQYESIVRQQQRYSPCTNWQGITVGQSAFFNSIFTLPTRSMLGFGTLFSSPYYHEFAVRSVLPTFRAHQKLKTMLGVDYMGPSDAMSQMPRDHVGKFYGSYAYWPPNNMYDCRQGRSTTENQCTWCKGIQYEGLDDAFDTVVPHGNMAAFLVSAMMEKSQFSSWIEDTKKIMTDWSEIYKPGYGLEVVAPARRTPRGGEFLGAYDGRGVWEALSHGYTVLSMYEGLATMRRRYELAVKAGLKLPAGSYEPPKYKPLSDFFNTEIRDKIDKMLSIARSQESTEKKCPPSDYGPPGSY